MNRLLATLKLDFLLQSRNKIYTISFGLAVVMGIALRFLFSREHAGQVLAVLILCIVGASTYFFGASMVLLEKSEGTLQALRTSPLSETAYIGSKVITLTGLVLVEGAIIYAISFPGAAQRHWPMVLGLILLAMMQTLIGLGQVAPHDAVTSFLIPGGALIGTILQLPVFFVFEAGPPWIWYLFPTQGPLLLILASFQELEAWQWIYALVGSTASLAVAALWARRRFLRLIGLGVA